MAQLVATTKTLAHKVKVMDPAAEPASSVESQAASMPAPADREQAIREAAYALFEARGCEPGHELDDWLEAEAQVLQVESAPCRLRHWRSSTHRSRAYHVISGVTPAARSPGAPRTPTPRTARRKCHRRGCA